MENNDLLVIFDTSTWIYIFKEIESSKNIEIISKIVKSGISPVLTLHTFNELFGCKDLIEIRKRIISISKFPIIHAIKSKNSILPGSILDLRRLEIMLLGKKKDITEEELIHSIKSEFSVFNHNLLCDFLLENDNIETYLQQISNDNINDSILASIIPDLFNSNQNTKIKDIRKKSDFHKLDDQEINQFKKKVKGIVSKKGDKKIASQDNGIENILLGSLNIINEKMKSIQDPLDFFAMFGNIEKEYLSDEMTIKEISLKIQHIGKIKHLCEDLPIIWQEIAKIEIRKLLSFFIEYEFQNMINTTTSKDINKRAEGSNINDKYISSFSPYIDTIVDKRTFDIYRRINDKLIPNLKIHKIKSVEELLKMNTV